MARLPSIIGCPLCDRTFVQKSGFSKLKTTKCPLCGGIFPAWDARFFKPNPLASRFPIEITKKCRPILESFREKYGKRPPEPVFREHISELELTYSVEIRARNSLFEREIEKLFRDDEEKEVFYVHHRVASQDGRSIALQRVNKIMLSDSSPGGLSSDVGHVRYDVSDWRSRMGDKQNGEPDAYNEEP